MKRTLIILFAILATHLGLFGQSNFYVSTTGNDANSGSIGAPWRTIQHGLDNMPFNSILNVDAGIYQEKIYVSHDNITIKNQTAVLPILDATGITSQSAIIGVTDKNFVTIEGLELRNNIQNYAQGIIIEGACNMVTVRNCVIHDIHFSANPNATVSDTTNAQGIIVFGSNAATPITNLTLENNELYDCRLGYSEGLAVNGNVDGFLVTQNTVHDISNIGIDVVGHEGTCPNAALDQARNGTVSKNRIYSCLSPYATSGGIYVDGGKNVVIEYNESYHNGYGIEIGCENIGKTTDAITVRNNVFYNNQVCGIAVGGFDFPAGSGKVTNANIHNNTCFSNDFSNAGNGELYLSYSENTTIENNVFYTSNQDNLVYADLTQPGINFNFNDFYCPDGTGNLYANWNGSTYTGFAAFVTGTSTNANSIFADPTFVAANVLSPDFHLQSTSLAIGAGNPSFVPATSETDYFGELRVENARVDCGADEYGTTSNTQDFADIQFLMYPNPASDRVTLEFALPTAKVVLLDLHGQQLMETHERHLDLQGLPSGVYFLQISSKGRAVSKMLVIE